MCLMGIRESDPVALIDKLQRYKPPVSDKWAVKRDAD